MWNLFEDDNKERQWLRPSVFVANFKQISDIVLIYIADFEQVIFGWITG